MRERSLGYEAWQRLKVARCSSVPAGHQADPAAECRAAHARRVPAVRVKDGVVLELHPALVRVLPVIDALHLARYGKDVVITSGLEGPHKKGSLHFRGLAVDLRTRDYPLSAARAFAQELRRGLGEDYNVVLEADHLHVEYDP